MSRYKYEMGGIIRDTEIDFPYYTDEIIELLDEKDQKITDLEAKLAENERALEAKESVNQMYKATLNLKDSDFSDLVRENTKLKQQLAEKEKLLNQYPYKNGVIEEQYEDLKDAITFLMLNNIKDPEQLNYSIDVLCEKHKARIRDIENSICKIEQLEKQVAEKEKEIEDMKASSDKNIDYLIEFASLIENEKDCNKMLKAIDRVKKGKKYIIDKQHQDKISFTIEKLEKVKDELTKLEQNYNLNLCDVKIYNFIDNQIKELKGNYV